MNITMICLDFVNWYCEEETMPAREQEEFAHASHAYLEDWLDGHGIELSKEYNNMLNDKATAKEGLYCVLNNALYSIGKKKNWQLYSKVLCLRGLVKHTRPISQTYAPK